MRTSYGCSFFLRLVQNNMKVIFPLTGTEHKIKIRKMVQFLAPEDETIRSLSLRTRAGTKFLVYTALKNRKLYFLWSNLTLPLKSEQCTHWCTKFQGNVYFLLLFSATVCTLLETCGFSFAPLSSNFFSSQNEGKHFNVIFYTLQCDSPASSRYK